MPLRNSNLIQYIIFLGCCLSFVKCKVPQANKEAPEINKMLKNKHFRINLPETHDSGYLWQLRGDFNEKVLVELNAVWHGNEKGVDFNFKPLSIGQTTINFVLIKYHDTLAAKRFVVKIVDN